MTYDKKGREMDPSFLALFCYVYLVFEHTLDFVAHGFRSPGGATPSGKKLLMLTVYNVFCRQPLCIFEIYYRYN